jgi:hypothetical protein
MIALPLLCGCGETRELTLYLQDLQVRGPTTRLPVHMTRNPEAQSITVMPSFWASTGKSSTGSLEGHSPVNASGVFQVDTIHRSDGGIYFRDPGGINTHGYAGKNLTWRYPSTGGGLDIDLGLSTTWALSLGASYSVAGGKGLWGYRAGLGLRQQKGNFGIRLDVGWDWESFAYESLTMASEHALSSTVADVGYFRDVGVSSMGNFYAALTINGAKPDNAVNLFLQLGLSRQTLQDYRPAAPKPEAWILPPFFLVIPPRLIVEDLRQKFMSTSIQITPGIYFDLDENMRLLVGGRVAIETEIEGISDPVLISPFVQIDWSL